VHLLDNKMFYTHIHQDYFHRHTKFYV